MSWSQSNCLGVTPENPREEGEDGGKTAHKAKNCAHQKLEGDLSSFGAAGTAHGPEKVTKKRPTKNYQSGGVNKRDRKRDVTFLP